MNATSKTWQDLRGFFVEELGGEDFAIRLTVDVRTDRSRLDGDPVLHILRSRFGQSPYAAKLMCGVSLRAYGENYIKIEDTDAIEPEARLCPDCLKAYVKRVAEYEEASN